MRRAGVAGAGAMGSGIAQVLLQSGVETVLFDVSGEALKRARRLVALGLKRAKKSAGLSLLETTSSLADLRRCEAVIEAVPEELGLKQALFAKLDALLPAPVLLATNTSSLSVTRIARAATAPARVAGLHFFNPPAAMKLVEVVKGEETSDEAVSRLSEFARSLGKTAAVCRDTPGFIVNRTACPFFQAAARLLEDGAGTPADIDRALKDAGLPMGPFELADLIGLDVSLSVQRSLYEGLGRPERFKPARGAAALAARGCLGRKNGRGFYAGGAANPLLAELFPGLGARPLKAPEIAGRVLAAVRAEARAAAAEGVAPLAAIDAALVLGMNWPSGILLI